MPLKAGTIADFSGSMAEAMEQAFEAAWQAAKGAPLPGAGKDDRRLLLSAIAQGVVKHLMEQAGDAFEIGVDVTQVNAPVNPIRSEGSGTVTNVKTSGVLY